MARYGRGRPAHPFISAGLIIVAVSDSDVFGTTVETESVAAATTSTDVFGATVEATSLVARFTATETITATDGNGTVAAEPSTSDTGASAEATSIVASLSHSDTGGGVESGAPPPATFTTADTGAGVESYGAVATSSNDPATGAEGTPSIAVADTEAISSAEGQDVDAFGGDSKLGQDSYSSTSASTIVATISSSDTASIVDSNPYQGVNDDEPITLVDRDSGTGVGIGILGVDVASLVDVGTVSASPSDTELVGYAESDPSIVLLISPALSGDTIQIRDNGVTPIGLFQDDPASIVDAQAATQIASTDTATAVDASSIVASRTEADVLTHTETEESPAVNLPTGIETIHYVEAGSPPVAHVYSADSLSSLDAEALDRGTPTSRLFVVEAEVRIKVIEAVTRVLEIPAEVRVLVVAGGFG